MKWWRRWQQRILWFRWQEPLLEAKRRAWREQMEGAIVRTIAEKGFGFILGEDNQEYFFHRSALKNERFEAVQDKAKVDFEPSKGPKGPRAENIYVK